MRPALPVMINCLIFSNLVSGGENNKWNSCNKHKAQGHQVLFQCNTDCALWRLRNGGEKTGELYFSQATDFLVGLHLTPAVVKEKKRFHFLELWLLSRAGRLNLLSSLNTWEKNTILKRRLAHIIILVAAAAVTYYMKAWTFFGDWNYSFELLPQITKRIKVIFCTVNPLSLLFKLSDLQQHQNEERCLLSIIFLTFICAQALHGSSLQSPWHPFNNAEKLG